jgi:RNA polymerase sigma-70 factor, ECF subfamily
LESTELGLRVPLKELSVAGFEKAFKTHFKSLRSYAFLFVKEDAMAEEIVQHVFYSIWVKRDRLNIRNSFKAYLYKSVYHECIYLMKKNKYKDRYRSYVLLNENSTVSRDNAYTKLEYQELQKKLKDALSQLPQQCLTIFHLSRFESLKYPQIAEQLGLSVKTVENQMGKALKRLRISLKDFLPLLICFLWRQ